MLGRFRLTVAECLEDFLSLLDKVWSHPHISIGASILSRVGFKSIMGDRYSYKVLERELKDLVKRRGPDGNEDITFRQQNEDTCRW